MRPHPNDLHRLDIIQNLVNEPMLDRDSAGTCAGEIRILSQDFEEVLDLWF
jgi:hypothetical protein